MNKKEMKLIKGTRFLSRSFQFNNKYYTKMIIDIGNIEIPIPLAYYKYFEVTPRKIRQIVNNNSIINTCEVLMLFRIRFFVII